MSITDFGTFPQCLLTGQMIVGLMGKGSGSEQYWLAWLMRLWFYRRAVRRRKARDSSAKSVGVRKSESIP